MKKNNLSVGAFLIGLFGVFLFFLILGFSAYAQSPTNFDDRFGHNPRQTFPEIQRPDINAFRARLFAHFCANPRIRELLNICKTIPRGELTISVSAEPISNIYAKGAKKIRALGLLFEASGTDSILKRLKFAVYVDDTVSGPLQKGTDGVAAAGNLISEARLFDGVTQIGESVAVNDDGEIIFDSLDLRILPGNLHKLVVEVDASVESLGSGNADRFKIGIEDIVTDIKAVDDNGIDIDVSGDSNGGASPTPDDGVIITITNSGALLISPDNNLMPVAGIVLAGQQDVLFGAFDFLAIVEPFIVTDFMIRNGASNGNFDDNVSEVTVTFPQEGGGMGTATTWFDGSGAVHFTGLDFFVGTDGPAKLQVFYDMGPIEANGGASDSGDQPQAIFEADTGFFASGVDSGIVITDAGNDMFGNAMILRNNKPEFENVTATSGLADDAEFTFFDVKVSAIGTDEMALKKLKFSFDMFDADPIGSPLSIGGDWQLFDVADLETDLSADSLAFGDGLGNADPIFTTAPQNATTVSLYVEIDSEERISTGASKTYRLKGSVVNAQSGDRVDVRLAAPEDMNVRTGAIKDSTKNLVQVANTDVSYAWSDLSAGKAAHSDVLGSSSSDWINGYKVMNLPGTGTRHTAL